jgi:hypothetical protein
MSRSTHLDLVPNLVGQEVTLVLAHVIGWLAGRHEARNGLAFSPSL